MSFNEGDKVQRIGGIGTVAVVDEHDAQVPYKVEWESGDYEWFGPDELELVPTDPPPAPFDGDADVAGFLGVEPDPAWVDSNRRDHALAYAIDWHKAHMDQIEGGAALPTATHVVRTAKVFEEFLRG